MSSSFQLAFCFLVNRAAPGYRIYMLHIQPIKKRSILFFQSQFQIVMERIDLTALIYIPTTQQIGCG